MALSTVSTVSMNVADEAAALEAEVEQIRTSEVRSCSKLPTHGAGRGGSTERLSCWADCVAATAQLPVLVRIDSQVQEVLRPSRLTGALRLAVAYRLPGVVGG